VTSTDGTRQPLSRVDTTTLLTAYLVLLLLVPSSLVIGALGAAGSPAILLSAGFGLLMLTWHLTRRADPSPWARPVAIAAALFAASILVAYAVATSRPINGAELSSADRGLITLTGWMGVLFLALYGPMTRERLDRLLTRLVAFVGFGAVLGIVQFYTGHTFVDQISIPGLSANQPAGTAFQRGGFVRPAGMASHPTTRWPPGASRCPRSAAGGRWPRSHWRSRSHCRGPRSSASSPACSSSRSAGPGANGGRPSPASSWC
jgi:hypothetical protein